MVSKEQNIDKYYDPSSHLDPTNIDHENLNSRTNRTKVTAKKTKVTVPNDDDEGMCEDEGNDDDEHRGGRRSR